MADMGKIEKGDIIALKDGREVEVLSVKTNGDELLRFDFVDRKEASPFRRTDYPSSILRLLRKGKIFTPDPKAERPYDNPVAPPLPVTVVPSTNHNLPIPEHKKPKGK